MIARKALTEAITLNFFATLPIPDEYFKRTPAYIEYRQLLVRILWRAQASELREDPRFDELVEQFNVIPYWEKYGWPEFCNPTEDGFDCHP